MNKEAFTSVLVTALKEKAGKEVSIKQKKIRKNNKVFEDAVMIVKNGCKANPVYLIEDCYDACMTIANIESMAENLLKEGLSKVEKSNIDSEYFIDFEKIKSKICYRIISYERNEDIMQEIPHVKIMDLAIVFYYKVSKEIIADATVMIRNQDLKVWNISFAELKEIAFRNTPRILPYEFRSMGKMLEDMSMGNLELQDDEEPPMYVLTNRESYLGAACIFYPHVLESVSKELNANLFILPSSIHETIILPDLGSSSRFELEKMVREVNETGVLESEILSDRVYYFDRCKKALI